MKYVIRLVIVTILYYISLRIMMWMGTPKWLLIASGIYLAVDLALIASGIREHGLWFWKR